MSVSLAVYPNVALFLLFISFSVHTTAKMNNANCLCLMSCFGASTDKFDCSPYVVLCIYSVAQCLLFCLECIADCQDKKKICLLKSVLSGFYVIFIAFSGSVAALARLALRLSQYQIFNT